MTQHDVGLLPPGPPRFPPLTGPGRGHSPRGGRSRAWVIGTVVGGAILAFVVVFIIGFARFANHDRLDFIELPAIDAAIAEPCERLADADSRAMAAPDAARPAALADVADAMQSVSDAVTALPDDVLDDDLPARGWAEDWRTMADGVRDYAQALAVGGEPTFATPRTEDGYTVVFRMESATGTCVVPESVVRLDPAPPPWPDNN